MQKIDFVNSTQPALNDTNLNLMQDYIEMAINAQVSGDTLPIGSVLPYAGTIIPANWLLCNGSEISRTDYSQLFNVIGTKYGTGDGSTTFNLPNLKGRVPVGQDSTQSEFSTLGKTGGEKTVTLTVDQMPSHNHSTNIGTALSTDSGGYRVGESGVVKINDNISRNSDSQGGGQAHNNLQPYIVQKYIIKAFQTAGTVAQIMNTRNTSTTNAYSCDYINSQSTYSATETRIGTWIDGKPLYRRVFTKATTDTTTTIDLSGLSYENIFIEKAWFVLNASSSSTSINKYVVDPYYASSSDKARALILSNSKIQLESTETASKLWYVIVKYTKTTD